MPRVRKGAARAKQRKRILRAARGYYGTNHLHKYRARRNRKRDLRALWITRITAACRMRGTRYSLFLNGLKRSGILLNRKMLSQLAIEEPKLFDGLVALAVKATRATAAAAA